MNGFYWLAPSVTPTVQYHAKEHLARRTQGRPSSTWQRTSPTNRSVNFLHLGGLVCSTLDLLKWWEVIIVTEALVIIINAQAKLDHAVNPACELGRLVKIEA